MENNIKEISVDDEGNFFIPKESMQNILKFIDENTNVTSELNSHYCCILREEYSDAIMDYHNYNEWSKEVATIKCKEKLGQRAELKNGHCDRHVPHD